MAQVLKEDVRQAILNSAIDRFVKEGYSGSSMREIAKGAQVTVGNLYRYFESKESLLEAILSEVVCDLDQVLRDNTDGIISFFTSPPMLADLGLKTMYANRILNGLNEMFPLLMDKHEKALILLLSLTENIKVNDQTFSLVEWLAETMKEAFSLKTSSRFVAIAMINGLEAIVVSNFSAADKMTQLREFVNFMTLRGSDI